MIILIIKTIIILIIITIKITKTTIMMMITMIIITIMIIIINRYLPERSISSLLFVLYMIPLFLVLRRVKAELAMYGEEGI